MDEGESIRGCWKETIHGIHNETSLLDIEQYLVANKENKTDPLLRPGQARIDPRRPLGSMYIGKAYIAGNVGLYDFDLQARRHFGTPVARNTSSSSCRIQAPHHRFTRPHSTIPGWAVPLAYLISICLTVAYHAMQLFPNAKCQKRKKAAFAL